MHHRRMRALSASIAALALLATAASFTTEAEARSCYKIWAEARGGSPEGGHYRHVVYVENDCEEWLRCTVWTDVDPQPPKMMSVAPGSTENAETNSHSEVDSPRAYGNCRYK